MKWRFQWDRRHLSLGLTAFLVIACSMVFYLIVSRLPVISAYLRHITGALSPLMYGFAFAYLLNKLMSFLEMWLLGHVLTAKKAARFISAIVTVLLVLLIIGGTLALVIPQTITSVQHLINRLPYYYNEGVSLAERSLNANAELKDTIVKLFGNVVDNLTKWLETTFLQQMNSVITNITSGVFSVLKELGSIVVGIILSIYILYNKDTLVAQSKRLVFGFFKAPRANRLLRNTRFLDKTIGSFFLGKIIESLIVGIISYIFLVIFSMPYAVLVAVLLGLTNVVPFFGPFIGAIPSVFMILLESPLKGLIFLIFIVVLHLFSGNVLSPRIQGETIGLGGFWILFAILLFGGLFGFWGLLLGVPVFAVIYAAVRKFNTTLLKKKSYPLDTKDYVNLSYIDPETGTPVYEEETIKK